MFLSRCFFATPIPLMLAMASFAWAVDLAGPLSLEDIRQLRRGGKQTQEIIKLAQQRRLSFAIDDATARTLRGMGFRRSMVESLTEVDANAVPTGPSKPRSEGPDAAARNIDPKITVAQAAFAARVQRINAASGLKLVVVPCGNVTVIADPSSATKYVPLIKQIDATIRNTFPAPLGTGPPAACIVLLPTTADYQRWIKTMYAVNHREGYRALNPDEVKIALVASVSFPKGMAVINLKKTRKWVRRSLAFNMGYLYMQGVTHGKAPAALVTGFGNMSEATLDGNPHIVLGSMNYGERHLPQRSGHRWIELLQQRVAVQRFDSATQLLAYRFSGLEEIQYAEAWSLVQLLASDPPRFAALTAAMRDGKEPLAAILAIYQVDEKQLTQRWVQLIQSVRR